ncbi:hypothetical protein M408DRAFT_28098 [Serendipita vermifera MAFF 305830]|uniref:Uncharacterized protein n=1 Tax=Serendipita vermifera MAFF 305830 TaxID=933852 RepID=A0A0C3AEX3_SERVB|nr:hypothetical protein M408DRAFT_28098 [Serendipita vermifera MAFF 305830]
MSSSPKSPGAYVVDIPPSSNAVLYGVGAFGPKVTVSIVKKVGARYWIFEGATLTGNRDPSDPDHGGIHLNPLLYCRTIRGDPVDEPSVNKLKTTLVIEPENETRQILVEFGDNVHTKDEETLKVESALMDLPGNGKSYMFYSPSRTDGVTFCVSILPPPGRG